MSQKSAILRALKKRQALTPLDALHRWGCFRLAARVAELRQEGHSIHTQLRDGIAVYRMVARTK